MDILNKARVDALFQREAVLIGIKDVVPVFRATALFGDRAVKYALAQDAPGERRWNRYSVEGYTLEYLTFRGFQVAASFYNVQQLREVAVEVSK